MKLKLRAEGDIQVLQVSELESAQNIDVLRAGITKIFKSGKNRIILELAGASAVPAELIRELGRFRQLANELSGDVVLAGLDPATQLKVQNFAHPPLLATFGKTEEAISHFKAPSPSSPTTAPKELTSAQALLQSMQVDQLEKLKKENDQLKLENQSLMALLSSRMIARREPPDAQAYREKIAVLEADLADLLEGKEKGGQGGPPKLGGSTS